MICKKCSQHTPNSHYCDTCTELVNEDIMQRMRIIMDAIHFALVGEVGDVVKDKEYRLRRINQALANTEALLQYEIEEFYTSVNIKASDLINRIKTYREQIEAGEPFDLSQHTRARLIPQYETLKKIGCESFIWATTANACNKCRARDKKVYTFNELIKEIGTDFCSTGECLVYLLPQFLK